MKPDEVTMTETSFTGTSVTRAVEKKGSIWKLLAWITLFLACLIAFTVIKLPQDQIKSYVEGQINQALAPRGLTFIAREGELSVGWGIHYALRDVSLISSQGAGTAKFSEIRVAPRLGAILTGKLGGALQVTQSADGSGKIAADFAKKGSDADITLKADQFDFGKSGLLNILSPIAIQMQGLLSGSAHIEGDFNAPNTLNGTIALDLHKVLLPEQNIVVLSLPRLQMNEGKIEADIAQGKIKPKNFYLGKAPTDDLRANVTGDITLHKYLDASLLNLKVSLGFSDAFMKSSTASLVTAFLTPVKQSDGTYLITVGGTLGSPMANILGGASPGAGGAGFGQTPPPGAEEIPEE